MSDDDVPTVTVETDGVSITVSDAMSAEAAMPFIEGALEHYLGSKDPTPRRQHTPVEVECGNCGYAWTYQGKSAHHATCPDCQKSTSIDAETDDRL